MPTGYRPRLDPGPQALDPGPGRLHQAHTACPQVLEFAVSCMSSADPLSRHAAMVVLASIAEGCSDHAQKRVGELLPLVLKGLQVGQAVQVALFMGGQARRGALITGPG